MNEIYDDSIWEWQGVTPEYSDNWRFVNTTIKSEYCKKNFHVEYTTADSKNCIIFFTSNGAYPHNTSDEIDAYFRKEGPQFEWLSIARSPEIQNYAKKIIYVRDVFKQWYVLGINNSINSVDALAGFLKEETEGYIVTTCGSSAGGYAAALFGALLHAEKVIDCSGQFMPELTSRDVPLMAVHQNDKLRNKYFDITQLLSQSEVPIYYIYPYYCEDDIRQLEHFEDGNKHGNGSVRLIRISSKNHGMPLLPPSVIRMIVSENDTLCRLLSRVQDRVLSPYMFLYQTNGMKSVVKYLYKKIKKRFSEK